LSFLLKFTESKKGFLKNIQNAGLYFSGSIVQALFALITQPIYSKYLSAPEFGILGYFEAVKSFFTPAFTLTMMAVYLMHYFRQDEQENKKLLFNITFHLLIINTFSVFIGYVGIYLYFTSLDIKIPLNPFAWYILIALLLDNIKHIVLINFRIRKKAFSFFILSVITTLLNVGIGLLFVAVFKWGAEGRMLAPIISTIILVPYCLHIIRKYTVFYVNFKNFAENLRIAFPLVLAAYAYVPISNIDRIFLERLNNISELGLYNIGITIAGYIQLAYTALALAFEPDVFQSVAQKNYKKLFQLFLVMFIPYLAAVLIFIILSGSIVNILTAGRYLGAQVYTNIAIISVFISGVYWFFDKTLIALGKTKLNLYINIIGGLSSLIVMYCAVTNYGFIGAAYGKILLSLLIAAIAGYFTLKTIYSDAVDCTPRIGQNMLE
jgi:O-antigen/teichoic acid export membrane protein